MISSQLSDALHVLLHLAQSETAITSDALAAGLATNPVVVRRLMGGLRDAGLVSSGKGHGGGWRMDASLDQVTLRDVYLALGAPPLVSLGFREDRPECLVAQVVNESLLTSMQQAEAALLEQFGRITLEALYSRVHTRFKSTAAAGLQTHYLLEGHHAPH